ncbi:SPTPR2B [Oopsacas minuta]|uniref:protein-tyrosine-phosphatase n=1 Tax=Oopsacas minuta TaxID=111878 RepID=A0AAV7K7E5_9METZ|nr:SPTPR2B [Oopsacas minuta]
MLLIIELLNLLCNIREFLIKQFHFTVWPDHGVPQFATSLIAFIRGVNRNQLTDTGGPHVVHCSAGVGRTGTYITLNSMLQRIILENNVNVYEFVRLMRSKRNYMVQTEEQFVFIYDALVELVTSGDTSIPSDLAIATINSYREMSGDMYRGEQMCTFSKQFLVLSEYSRQPNDECCAYGMLEENKNKNRFTKRIPYDDYRVRITPSGDGTDYINASFVDGYKQKRAYIATQSPSSETVGEFWRMVYEKESAVIVMLCNLIENGNEMCYKYWPDKGEEVKFQLYTIKNLEERREEGFLRRRLLVVFSFHNKYIGSTVTAERKVTQLCLEEWPNSNLAENLTPFLTIIDAVERLQAANQNPPITVHCEDGVGRTGTFLTMFSVLEKLKPEHLVDVFQILKKARIQRPMLVDNKEQYEMCYNFVFCYLESFDAYANFCVKSNENFRIEGADSDTEILESSTSNS